MFLNFLNNKKMKKTLFAFGLFLCMPSLLQAAFSDVSSDHLNYDAINYVQQNGIVNGYPDGTYKPDEFINRAEFTKIVIEASFPGQALGSNCFPDVTAEWFSKYVCFAKGQGIISEYPDGTFKPGNNVAFSEDSKIIVNSVVYPVCPDKI